MISADYTCFGQPRHMRLGKKPWMCVDKSDSSSHSAGVMPVRHCYKRLKSIYLNRHVRLELDDKISVEDWPGSAKLGTTGVSSRGKRPPLDHLHGMNFTSPEAFDTHFATPGALCAIPPCVYFRALHVKCCDGHLLAFVTAFVSLKEKKNLS